MFQSIESFFSRFKRFTIPNELVRKATCQAIKEICHIDLRLEEVSIQGGIVYIVPIHPIIKSEIFLRKEDILFRIKKLINRNLPLDIR